MLNLISLRLALISSRPSTTKVGKQRLQMHASFKVLISPRRHARTRAGRQGRVCGACCVPASPPVRATLAGSVRELLAHSDGQLWAARAAQPLLRPRRGAQCPLRIQARAACRRARGHGAVHLPHRLRAAGRSDFVDRGYGRSALQIYALLTFHRSALRKHTVIWRSLAEAN